MENEETKGIFKNMPSPEDTIEYVNKKQKEVIHYTLPSGSFGWFQTISALSIETEQRIVNFDIQSA